MLEDKLYMTDKDFFQLREFIEKNFGLKIPDYKKYLLESRLMSRMRALNIYSYKQYIEYVFNPAHKAEIFNMIDVVTTHKTDFFREKDHFDFIQNRYLPKISENKYVKIWSSASSTGEEVYTIAISFMEYNRLNNKNIDFFVYGSDVSKGSLEMAASGIYSMGRIEGLPLEIRNRYFLKHKDPNSNLTKLKQEVINKTSFFYLNLNNENYSLGTEFDIIFCRNVLIYFNKQKQEEILQKIINYLKPNGLLFIGHSESLFSMTLPVKLIQSSIYQKLH